MDKEEASSRRARIPLFCTCSRAAAPTGLSFLYEKSLVYHYGSTPEGVRRPLTFSFEAQLHFEPQVQWDFLLGTLRGVYTIVYKLEF